MNGNIADKLLPIARKIIKTVAKEKYGEMFVDKNKLSIKEIYENYTAAFGMTINQSGFQSAFAIYNETGTNSEGKKCIVTQLLYEILKASEREQDNYGKIIIESEYEKCRDAIIDGIHNRDEYELFFKEASIALKRALRTFELVKKIELWKEI